MAMLPCEECGGMLSSKIEGPCVHCGYPYALAATLLRMRIDDEKLRCKRVREAIGDGNKTKGELEEILERFKALDYILSYYEVESLWRDYYSTF